MCACSDEYHHSICGCIDQIRTLNILKSYNNKVKNQTSDNDDKSVWGGYMSVVGCDVRFFLALKFDLQMMPTNSGLFVGVSDLRMRCGLVFL